MEVTKELIPTSCPYITYQFSDAMLKHLPKDSLKRIEKTMLYSKEPVYLNKKTLYRRVHDGSYAENTGTTAQIVARKANQAKDLNIDDIITKFKNQLKNEYAYRIPLCYFTDLGKINFALKINFVIKCYLETEMKNFFESQKLCLLAQLFHLPMQK